MAETIIKNLNNLELVGLINSKTGSFNVTDITEAEEKWNALENTNGFLCHDNSIGTIVSEDMDDFGVGTEKLFELYKNASDHEVACMDAVLLALCGYKMDTLCRKLSSALDKEMENLKVENQPWK